MPRFKGNFALMIFGTEARRFFSHKSTKDTKISQKQFWWDLVLSVL